MREGKDFAGRSTDWKGVPFSFRVDARDLPSYILDNKEKYSKYFRSE